MKARNLTRYFVGTGILLLIPLVAMMFTDEVNWGLGDFVIIGTLLISAVIAFELITSLVKPKYRPIIAAMVILAVMLIWAELAVGVFGTPFAGS